MVKEKQEEERIAGAFNSAVATLERIDGVLKNIHSLSIRTGRSISAGSSQSLKLKYAKDLLLISSPLLKPEQIKGLRTKLKSIKFTLGKTNWRNEKMIIYSREVNDELDDIIIEIQVFLQENGGYMMPSSSDARYSWGVD